MTIGSLAEVFKALADPTRQKIYRLLVHEELCVCELAAVFGVSQSAISQHLRRLKAVDLVQDRRRGQWVFYRGNPRSLDDLIRLLGELRSVPPQSQDDLREAWLHMLQVKQQNLCGIRGTDGKPASQDGGRTGLWQDGHRSRTAMKQEEDVKV